MVIISVYVNQMNMLYISNLHSDVCRLFLNTTEIKTHQILM